MQSPENRRPLRNIGKTYRREETGRNLYAFTTWDRLLGTAVTRIQPPDFSMMIRCGALTFYSGFDPETTLVPNSYRDIVDGEDPSRLAARLIWQGRGKHQLALFWDKAPLVLQICTEGRAHRFWVAGQLVAEILPLSEKQQLMGWEWDSCMKVYGELPHETLLLMLCFPLLRFAP